MCSYSVFFQKRRERDTVARSCLCSVGCFEIYHDMGPEIVESGVGTQVYIFASGKFAKIRPVWLIDFKVASYKLAEYRLADSNAEPVRRLA